MGAAHHFCRRQESMIQSVEEEASAINPNNAVAVCTKLPKNSIRYVGVHAHATAADRFSHEL